MAVPSPERVLLVRLSHLGDVVHALPVFHALRSAWPEASIGWAVQNELSGLLEGLEGLERLFPFDRRGGLRAWLRLRRELRAWSPDVCVDAQGNLKSAAATWFAGAPRRIGLARQDWREPLGARVLTEQAPPAYGPHAVHKMLALCERVAPRATVSFDLSLSAAERARGVRALEQCLPGRFGPGWILHLSPEDDPRSWPGERFAALARGLAGRGGGVLLVSGPAEAELGARLEGELTSGEGIAHWVGQRGLRELVGTLTAAAAAGARFVGADSGPAHLAAACGMGVDLLSGPQDPQLTGPWPLAGRPGSPHRLLRAVPDGLAPMEALTVEAVLETLCANQPA